MSKLTESFILDQVNEYETLMRIGDFKTLLKFLDNRYKVRTTQQYQLLTDTRVRILNIKGIYYEGIILLQSIK